MSRGGALAMRTVEAEIVADVGQAIAVRVTGGKWRRVDGRARDVVVQVRTEVDEADVATMLRQLANRIERG